MGTAIDAFQLLAMFRRLEHVALRREDKVPEERHNLAFANPCDQPTCEGQEYTAHSQTEQRRSFRSSCIQQDASEEDKHAMAHYTQQRYWENIELMETLRAEMRLKSSRGTELTASETKEFTN